MLQCPATILLPECLPEIIRGGADAGTVYSRSAASRSDEEPGMETFIVRQRITSDARDLYADVHRQLDRLLLPRVVELTGGSLQEAALELGIARQTLRMKLRELGLHGTRPAEVNEGTTE
jgi:two-component system nitrogen regulation response regulator GlnG